MINVNWTAMNMLPLLDRAIAFAVMKHSGQPRKGTGLPYITHVVEAMEIVSHMTEDEELRAAAVLHDTLEDTETTKEELVQLFGQRVADLVAAESEDKRKDQPEEETWWIRKQETIKHLSEASTEIRMLALGDKLSNVRAMHRDYEVIGEELWQRFNEKDPIKQGMYYGQLANAFWADEALRETPAYKEYVELCSDLFSKEYDGDGNLIQEDDDAGEYDPEDEEEDEGLPVRCFFADAMDEVRASMPEGTKAWALILDRTEDPDLLEIQKMAMTLDALLRTEDVGFADVHMKIVNEPGTDDVSWKRTEDGYALHLCAECGKGWDQVAFQLGYLMMHCLIDHLGGKDREGISWVEELICESATLELLYELYQCWELTPFGQEDPDYDVAIQAYIEGCLSDEGTSALHKCRDKAELEEINRKNSFDDRLDESHELYQIMDSDDLLILAEVRKYEADDLLLYTHYWRNFSDGSEAVKYLCRLQERIEGCEIPAGINHEINLRDSKPTEEQKKVYEQMIRSLRPLPCEYIIFDFLDANKKDKEQIGLVFFQVCREKDGKIDAEMRLDTKQGRKMFGIDVDDDQAIGFLRQILDRNEVPDTEGWTDFTDKVFKSASETESDAGDEDSNEAYDDDEFNDLNEWDIMENILHPNGRDDD